MREVVDEGVDHERGEGMGTIDKCFGSRVTIEVRA